MQHCFRTTDWAGLAVGEPSSSITILGSCGDCSCQESRGWRQQSSTLFRWVCETKDINFFGVKKYKSFISFYTNMSLLMQPPNALLLKICRRSPSFSCCDPSFTLLEAANTTGTQPAIQKSCAREDVGRWPRACYWDWRRLLCLPKSSGGNFGASP